MRIWMALIVAPLLALADLTVSYAAVAWSCAHQAPFAVHAAHALFLIGAAACTLGALVAWRDSGRLAATGESPAQVHFLAGVAFASGALSTATIAAMWIPTWIVVPCLS